MARNPQKDTWRNYFEGGPPGKRGLHQKIPWTYACHVLPGTPGGTHTAISIWNGSTETVAPSPNLCGSAEKYPEVPSCNFLIFATASSSSLVFPSLPVIFSSSLMTVSLLTPLQTGLLRASTDAALRWASEPDFFFNMLATMFLSAISCLFFTHFPAFSYGAFPQCPHFPNGVLKFPWLFQACHSFSPPLSWFFNMFLYFPPFATLRHVFLGITPHPLANSLAPNPNGRCSPLSFGSLVFWICLPLCS